MFGGIDMNKNYISTKNVLIFWAVVILIGWIAGGSGLGLGLLLAAVISVIIMQYTLNSSWEGVIENIKNEKVYSGDPNSDHHEYREVLYANLKLNNGKNKKIHAYPNWKVGDKIKKEKGKMDYEKV